MAAVTASTKTDSPKIDLAGVETGAKIFVGLTDGAAGSVAAAAATAPQKTTRDIWNILSVFEYFVPRIFIELLVSSLGSFPRLPQSWRQSPCRATRGPSSARKRLITNTEPLMRKARSALSVKLVVTAC